MKCECECECKCKCEYKRKTQIQTPERAMLASGAPFAWARAREGRAAQAFGRPKPQLEGEPPEPGVEAEGETTAAS